MTLKHVFAAAREHRNKYADFQPINVEQKHINFIKENAYLLEFFRTEIRIQIFGIISAFGNLVELKKKIEDGEIQIENVEPKDVWPHVYAITDRSWRIGTVVAPSENRKGGKQKREFSILRGEVLRILYSYAVSEKDFQDILCSPRNRMEHFFEDVEDRYIESKGKSEFCSLSNRHISKIGQKVENDLTVYFPENCDLKYAGGECNLSYMVDLAVDIASREENVTRILDHFAPDRVRMFLKVEQPPNGKN